MCATACKSHSTCFFKSPHADWKPTQVGVPAGQGLWPDSGPLGPKIPEVDEDVRWDPPTRIIRPNEGNVRLRLNMGYLSGQIPQ